MDLLAFAGWIAGWLAAGRSRRLPRVPLEGLGGLVSVVVPARNEATRLPRLLAALDGDGNAARRYEVIVVDDSSTDETAAVARSAGAVVVDSAPPAGWTGKSWACWQGALASRGDVLVFLDADTEPAPGFVDALAAAAAASDGLVSVQPSHRTERPYEQLSAVCNVVALMAGTGAMPAGPGRGRWWRGPVGFGPAMAVPRARYVAAGGHARVRADIVEDMALARAFDGLGIPVAAFEDGSVGSIRYRMYPQGMASLWEGWTKNLAVGAGRVPILRAALVAIWVTGGLRSAGPLNARPAGYALYALQAVVLFRRAGAFHPLLALAYPLPLAIFVVLAGHSALRRAAGRPVSWRGRLVMT